MTVGTKLHQTLASLEDAKAQLKSFSLETEDQQAKANYAQWAQQLDNVVQGLSGRVNYAESQEPQYQVFNQAQQKAQQQQQKQ